MKNREYFAIVFWLYNTMDTDYILDEMLVIDIHDYLVEHWFAWFDDLCDGYYNHRTCKYANMNDIVLNSLINQFDLNL